MLEDRHTSVTAPGSRIDIGAIQYLRAIAALLVVFHHALDQFPEIAARFPIDTGASGVDIFFVISGFVMTYTARANKYGAVSFLVRRAVRIVPLYWSMTLFVAILLLVAPSLVRQSKFSFHDLLLSLLFIPHVNTGDQSLSPMVKLGWTLNYEAFFYVIFALVITLSGLRRTAALATIFFIFILSAATFDLTTAPLRFWANLLLFEFVLGCLVAHFYLSDTFSRLPWIAFSLLTAAGIIGLTCFGIHNPGGHRLFFYGLPGTVLVIGMLGMEWLSAKPWQNRLWRFLGDASYSIYLTHLYAVVGFRILWERGDLPKDGPIAAIIFVGLCSIVGVIVGSIVFRYIEQPMTTWLQRRILSGTLKA